MQQRKLRYSKELLEPIVARSTNFWGVVRELGLLSNTATWHRVKLLVQEFEISTDHFIPQRRGGRGLKVPIEERLVLDRYGNGRRESTDRLRETMKEYGFEEKCAKCGQLPIWNDEPLVLHVDHKNGNGADNRPENLRFICPNCHSQTDNYCGRAKRGRKQAPRLTSDATPSP